MSPSFFFYDLETFGINPKEDRIAQFAGIRTDENFNIIEEPINIYCHPPEDYLPDPNAILITGITLEEAQEKGLSEAQFATQIAEAFSRPNSCILGYNNIRFDDEMIRYLFYRNFIDPYAYSWQNGNSRWDLLDIVRATYTFRPEGIEWPQDEKGNVSFKLENLSKANHLLHEKAHDALSDVYATIGMAKLIKERQPRLFSYYFNHRRARDLQQLIDLQKLKPLLHISGMFGLERNNISMITPVLFSPQNRNELISIDLMGEIEPLLELPAETIREKLYTPTAELPEGEARIPLKGIHLNRCPVLAPTALLSTLPSDILDQQHCLKNHQLIIDNRELMETKLMEIYQTPRDFESDPHSEPVESLLYQGFFERKDRHQMDLVPKMNGEELKYHEFYFDDPRLDPLLFIYRARNYFETLFEDEQEEWQRYILLKREYYRTRYQPTYEALLEEATATDDHHKIALLQSIGHYYQS
ncbi:exodeoxyribonuclease I [Ignatzschineria cameli]|uniref:Exodeoxyribonuclease I n=1 Tax=Ignatzschineria cameli TaxID=2182793 RepID=A0A2U2AR58_9GAMM|nr:exodeoxyribonuclease I [Ignatzschineria cameli]PWD86365.1 exodeoxyribonuclease I [Ignatzschineria cameli]PWD89797.1 exodeoxyribonuclease I [Ignatzschineria cameli]PWD91447.1 exodeoxyribonuclease I [Ignatzschineria cameli]PWD92485.1 exodeoxyribonuclease I [Ignatzschineria cameli]